MERIALPDYSKIKRKRINKFWELCNFYAGVWNNVPDTKNVTANRFMRDCSANRRAYELAQIDYFELINIEDLKHKLKEPKAKARLLFGRLKARKDQLNG